MATWTAEERNAWAQIRQTLRSTDKLNEATIEIVEAAAFVVCLDNGRPTTPSERCNQFFLEPEEEQSQPSLITTGLKWIDFSGSCNQMYKQTLQKKHPTPTSQADCISNSSGTNVLNPTPLFLCFSLEIIAGTLPSIQSFSHVSRSSGQAGKESVVRCSLVGHCQAFKDRDH